MIFFQIDKKDKSNHIYQQIYKSLKEAILERKIPTNEKLPSKRKLAEKLEVSINSVSNAYEQLLAEGYIYAIERKGYYVENITQFNNQKEAKMNFPDDLKEEFSKKDEGWLSLSHMTADISMFPFKEWMKCEKIAIKNHKNELSDISHPQGPYLVRKTISRMIALTRGVKCEPEQVIIGPGTQPLLRQVLGMQRENIKAAIENPGYSRIYQLLKDMNFEVFPIDLDKKGIDIKKVEALNPHFLFITPSHQFPTGIIMPISRRIELLNWASASEGRYIVEDDYDSEFKYGTDNIPSLQSLDRNQRVIYAGTFSKTIMPSFRISYLVLPPDLLREYKRHFSYWIQGSNTLNLFTLHYFIESGEYAKHVKRMNNHYEMKRENLIKELKWKFRNDIKIKNVPAGLHFIAEFKTDKGYKEIEERAKKEKLEIYSMKRFNLLGNIEEGKKIILIIGFANIKNEDIPVAVDRLYRVIY
ncbi:MULTISPECIES: PLP-dependent aminotransferase family protein [Aeribacillus]|jgi:GntR family transcriptional regulator/MocR family aminotransferase|uniref:MocR-like transcriptional regulator GabR n=1 Tax=Aeribacillus composti TaxID=1868734 RepID=UPI002E1FF321|nr:PLP-dependent aminotransferase family protein [Aeribacillus composti]